MGVARTRAGLRKCRATRAGSRVAVVAPASGFDRAQFDLGLAELRRLGFEPVYDDSVFDRSATTAGAADVRAAALRHAWAQTDVDAIIAVRGGYGSVETLPLLAADDIPDPPASLVGYSDITSLHVWLNLHVGVTSVHGAMLEGRLAHGPDAYDPATLLRSLGTEPLGEVSHDGIAVLNGGDARGVFVGGTVTQLASSLGTPYAFSPPAGAILFLDEVGERPYRLRRLLMQLRLAGTFDRASAIVFGQLPKCDEPGGSVTSRTIVEEFFAAFPGPVLFGFPSGHTTTPLLSLPLGVDTRVVTGGKARLVFEEAAAA